MEQENIKEFIKKLRKEHNLTQKDLADRLGVTYQAVSKWERGLNIPDISILKEISKIYNIDIDSIINGNTKKAKKNINKFIYIFGSIVLVILNFFIIFLVSRSNTFYLKKVSSDCKDFTLNGSVAYSKDKSSIYISNIDYCGEEDTTTYKEIECNLYEEYDNTKKVISTCISKKNLTLEEYLKNIEIKVDNYEASCKVFSKANIFLEIKLKNDKEKVNLYQIPLKLEGDCND